MVGGRRRGVCGGGGGKSGDGRNCGGWRWKWGLTELWWEEVKVRVDWWWVEGGRGVCGGFESGGGGARFN